VLSTAANTVNAGGAVLGNVLSSGPVQQVTQPISTAITPIVLTAGLVTQQVGTSTGLGVPLSGVLAKLGGAVSSAGTTFGSAASTATNNPLGADVGTLVASLGNTVTNAGGLVNPNGPNGAAPIPGLIVSLVGSSNYVVLSGPPTGAAAGGPLGPLKASLTSLGLGSTPLSNLPVGSLTGVLSGTPLGGVLSNTPLNSILTATPLSGTISGVPVVGALLAGTITNSASSAGGTSGTGGVALLQPVTALVGTVTGTLSSTAGGTSGTSGSSSSSGGLLGGLLKKLP
jgi:hypothetical protein